MVTSSVVMVTGHQMQKRVNLHPRSFPKAMKYFVTTLYRHCTGRTFSELEEQRGLPEGRGGAMCMFEVPGLDTTWLLRTRVEGDQPLACFDDFHQRT